MVRDNRGTATPAQQPRPGPSGPPLFNVAMARKDVPLMIG